MTPKLQPGWVVCFRFSRRPKLGQIVCVKYHGRDIVKRLVYQTQHQSYLGGSRAQSATYIVPHQNLKGVLFFRLRLPV